MIAVESLNKSFGARQAVAGVSFEISQGACFGLLGPNGAGKTTTIRMLTGSLAPDSGRITLNGRTDPGKPEVRREIGLAPQSLAIYEELTGEENLAFIGRLYRLRGKRLHERISAVLELVGLQDRWRDRVGTYSGGMKRRLNMACAVINEPKILFLDEPTVGVDPQSRNWIFQNIESLKAGGTTVVYTTHYMEEAERLCDEVAIMDQGRIIASGTVDELIREHGGLSLLTAEFDNGEKIRQETAKPFAEMAALTRTGQEVKHLRVDRPDLEAVFLNLTGRSLRDK